MMLNHAGYPVGVYPAPAERPRTPLEIRADRMDADLAKVRERLDDLEARLARYEGRV